MKRKINIVMLLIVTLAISLLAFTACGNDNNESANKQIPVYQGMTITKSKSTRSLTSASYRSSGIALLRANKENNVDNGNHYGHYKGDHANRNDTIDEENPYPENGANENIEEEIKASFNVVGSPDTIYYATLNEDIYINIHIDNPDSFEIMSFTLNGKKYSSYMFEEGSDMETIVLKYNVGNAAGIVEYTIDAIKYIDGTEIKDVIIDGNKTVMAGVKTENQVAANVTGVDIDTDALSFNVNVKDRDSLVEFSKGALKAVIYDGFNIVSEKDIAVGENTVTFEGLETNTLYQYAVVGYYDDLSGNGFGMNVLYKDTFYTDSVVLFDNIEVGQEGISFGYLWHEDHGGKAISTLNLYKGDSFVKEIAADTTTVNDLLSNTTYKLVAEYPNCDKTESIYLEFATFAKAIPEITVHTPTKTQTSVGFTITEIDTDNVGAVTKIELVHADGTLVADSLAHSPFANLLSNNEYTVKVTYIYDLNDGEGEHTVTKELVIITDAKTTPDFTISNTAKGQENLGFSISVTDTDSVGAITKVELIHGTEVTTLANVTTHEITKLLSNNDYTIKVTYAYNLNDGVGDKTLVKELTAKTEAKTVPSFDVKNESMTTTGINAEYEIADVDNILASYKVELYQGTTLVSENADKKISFASLDYYTDYTLKITYTYDLNDGNGVQSAVFENSYKTLPFIDVTECSIANTSAVSEGDTIFMSVKLDNPLGMSIESVVINGETYSVASASTKNKIFVEIVYNGQFAGGDTYLKIDKVNAKLDNAPFIVEPKSELSDNVFINGKLEVLKIEFVNEDIEPINWAFPSEKVYVLITLNNFTGYQLDCANGTITDLTKIDNEHWYYYVDYTSTGWNTQSLTTLSYSLGQINKTLTFSQVQTSFYEVASNETVYITTPDDLKSMNEAMYYELTNDIDLSGIEWIGNDFNGVFNGKDYAIINMSFVGTIKNTDAYLGLFSKGTGVVEDLVIKNATIIADIISDDGDSYKAYCGGLFGYTYGANTISNCSIDENSILSAQSSNNSCYDIYCGGLVGSTGSYLSQNKFINCKNTASVSGFYAGGILGRAYDPTITFINCFNGGNISGNTIGSILGFVHADHGVYRSVIIRNCVNAFYITHCGIIGEVGWGTYVNIANTFALESEYNDWPANICTISELNSKSFYTETLGWSESVWNFSELDVENGKYPHLK